MRAKPAPTDNLLALPDGTELVGDYRIKRVLGAGGFGITYLADEKALNRLVTIKEYFPADFAARKGGSAARALARGGRRLSMGPRPLHRGSADAGALRPSQHRARASLLPRQQHRLHGAALRGRRQLQVVAQGPQSRARARPSSTT